MEWNSNITQPLIDFLFRYIQITREELATLLPAIRYLTTDKDILLMQSVKTIHVAGFILKGYVRSFYYDEEGKDITLNFHFENKTLISLEGFFGNKICTCSSVTMEPSELIFITRTDFNNFLHKYPRFEMVLRGYH